VKRSGEERRVGFEPKPLEFVIHRFAVSRTGDFPQVDAGPPSRVADYELAWHDVAHRFV
jgi:hypothetical protein